MSPLRSVATTDSTFRAILGEKLTQAETGQKAQKDNKANTKINKNTKFNANSEWEDPWA